MVVEIGKNVWQVGELCVVEETGAQNYAGTVREDVFWLDRLVIAGIVGNGMSSCGTRSARMSVDLNTPTWCSK
jgi:hypothetical protein